ncbi:alpha/beta hydrolase [Rhodococcus aerolatus]
MPGESEVAVLAHTDHGGDGVPVVLLHAFPLDSRTWDDVVAELGGAVRAVSVDLPGLGGSSVPGEPPSLEHAAHGVLEVLDHLGVERAVVVGLSTGGYVAAVLARDHPGRLAGLGLCSTTTRVMAPDVPAGRRDVADEVERTGSLDPVSDSVQEGLGETAHAHRPDLEDRVRTVLTSQDPAGVAWVARAVAARSDTSDAVRGVPVPVLLLFGEEDTATPPARAHELAALRPDAELVLLPATGHLTCLERPAEVAAALTRLAARSA